MEPAAQRFNLLLLLPLVFLAILLGFGGYYLGLRQGLRLEQPSKTQPQEQTTITEGELPIGLSFLKNPIINQWRGTVKGKLVAKEKDSIIIEDDKGNRIVIQIRPLPKGDLPQSSLVKGDTPSSLIDLAGIPLGANVQSEFIVGEDKNALFGIQLIYFEGAGE